MSTFGDYKAYKKYEPYYSGWKKKRDEMEARRLEYLRKNPQEISQESIQRGKALIRAIDVMDEYSQKRAEDMEVATETVVSLGLQAALFGGAGVGILLGRLKPVQKLIKKFVNKNASITTMSLMSTGVGMLAAVIAAFPMYAWAAKAEVAASRRGRFEAMRKDLENPNAFAVLTEEQILEAQKKSKDIVLKDKKDTTPGLESFKVVQQFTKENAAYKKQRQLFNAEIEEAEKHLNDEMTPEEIEKAKKDQQLLTNLVEKIDIASQDYAENAELATGMAIALASGFGSLFALGAEKILKFCGVKSATKISLGLQVAGILMPVVMSIFAAQIQKQASRVGRFKVKQELLNNPAKLAYVSDEKAMSVGEVDVTPSKKNGYFAFFKNIWKNNEEYNKYKKTMAKQEENFYKAVENIEITPEQKKDALVLQKNTFRTFNKIDENSQKYSESVEALAAAINTPIIFILNMGAMLLGGKFFEQGIKAKTNMERISGMNKYVAVVLLSILPATLINVYITSEQKKASRIADMLSIQELNDYRKFRG